MMRSISQGSVATYGGICLTVKLIGQHLAQL